MAFLSGTGERRRRVLTEQLITTPSAAASDSALPETAAAGRPGRSYAKGALGNQPALVDIMPSRYRTIFLWVVLAASAAAGLHALYYYAPRWTGTITARGWQALDLGARSSLAAWFGSLLLGLCAVGSLAIYSVRRHKADDYRGRYRVWLWAAAALLLLSSDVVAGLHGLLQDLMVPLAAKAGVGNGPLWGLAVAGLVLGAIGIRIGFELRPCRLALATFCLAIGCFSVKVAAAFGWLPLEDGASGVLQSSGLQLGGIVLLLTSLLLFARHVLLDARGEIAPRRARNKPAAARERSASAARKKVERPSAVDSTSDADGDRARQNGTRSAQPAAARRSDLERTSRPDASDSQAASQWVGGEDEEDDDESGTSHSAKLSKAERKRLRRKQRAAARA